MSSTLSTSFFPQADSQCRLSRFKNSFVPLSIKDLNGKLARGLPCNVAFQPYTGTFLTIPC